MPEIFGAALMGGGSGPAYAAIGVTYPAGATCTCALGNKTFTAPDTSGQALFIVPTAGEWVVTISQTGQQPVSQTISVTESKAYVITLVFDLILYDAGDQYTEVTGGWKAFSGITFQEDSIQLAGVTGSYYATTITNNKVDISEFSILRVYGSTTSKIRLAITSNNSSDDFSAVANTYITTPDGPYNLDVSEISGEYYVALQSMDGTTIVDRVVLLKNAEGAA